VTLNIPTDAKFVPTDEVGRQLHEGELTRWSLPRPSAPGSVAEAAPGGVHLLDVDELLEELGPRVFVAAANKGAPELSVETAWSPGAAARFALDCAQHLLDDASGLPPTVSGTLADVLAAARKSLDKAADVDTGLLGRFSRRSLARRLTRQGDHVGDVAFDLAVDAEVADVDIFDDAAWTAAAATRDAVLAAVEAIRHEAIPNFAEETSREEKAGAEVTEEGFAGTFDTPWGPFHAGMRRVALPVWAAAGEAAERARQSVADSSGPEAASEERAWQRERLLAALRGG